MLLFKSRGERQIDGLHREEAVGLADVLALTEVRVIDEARGGPLQVLEHARHTLAHLGVASGHARHELVLRLVAESRHHGATCDDGDPPVRGESGDGRDGVVTRRAQEDVRFLLQVHVNRLQGTIGVRALAVSFVDLEGLPLQEVGAVADGLDGVVDARPGAWEAPLVGGLEGQDDTEFDHVVPACRARPGRRAEAVPGAVRERGGRVWMVEKKEDEYEEEEVMVEEDVWNGVSVLIMAGVMVVMEGSMSLGVYGWPRVRIATEDSKIGSG